MAAKVLESAYDWRPPVAVSSGLLVVCVGLVAASQAVGWLSAAILLVLGWAAYLGVVWLRTQAYLMVDGDTLTVRTFRDRHAIVGADLVKVVQVLTPSGPSYRLSVRTADGSLRRYRVPTALLRGGHSTLFRWILTWAPQAELDKGSRRTLQTLRDRGTLSHFADDQPSLQPDRPTDER